MSEKLGLTDEDRRKLAQLAEGIQNGGQAGSQKVELSCEACGDTFEVIPSRRDRRFCSRECWDEAQSSKVELFCEACGDTFEVIPSRRDSARFCSRECWAEAGGRWA